MPASPTTAASPWPHRWSIALACATFPLLWVGGLVTTTDAGMAVYDWPTTFGYNPLLYPWRWWLFGPWDLFIEHGHRLFAGVINLLTLGLLISLWRNERRRWMRAVGISALLLVLFQDFLGGMRVRLDERTLAMLHGMTGPLFFALTVSLAVFTSPRWSLPNLSEPPGSPRRDGVPALAGPAASLTIIPILTVAICVLSYLQIAIGAVLRHVPIGAEPGTFALAVRFHLFLAAILTLHIALLCWKIWRHPHSIHPLRVFASALALLLVLQLALGAGTWLVKFAAPTWAPSWVAAARAVQDGGWLQTHVITAHVATGSLILATATALALHAWKGVAGATPQWMRLGRCPSHPSDKSVAPGLEAAL